MLNFRLTPAVKYILIANVAVFILLNIALRNTFIAGYLPLYFFKSDYFLPHQFLTYMFMHGDMMHLLSNMAGVLIFGPLLEQFWGSKRFLIFFMVCGIGSGVLYSGFKYLELSGMDEAKAEYFENRSASDLRYFVHNYGSFKEAEAVEFIDSYEQNPDSIDYVVRADLLVNDIYELNINTTMVGASGAVFGILLALAVLFPNTVIFPYPIPVKAKYIAILLGAGAYFGAIKNAPDDNVAHVAHLSGMLIGLIMVRYWQKSRKNFY